MVDTKIGGAEGGDLGSAPVGTEEWWLQDAAGNTDFFWPLNTARNYFTQSGRAIFAPGQWGYWTAFGNASSMQADGALNSISVIDTTSSAIFADGVAMQQDTAASIGSGAQVRSTAFHLTLAMIPLAVFKVKLSSAAGVRVFIGLSNGSNPATADSPADAVGVTFSTDFPDTNWQFYADIGGTPTRTDSGVAGDTAIHYIIIDSATPSSVTVRLMNSAFVEQASTTFTTELPASGTSLHMMSALTARAAAIKSLNQYYATVLYRNS